MKYASLNYYAGLLTQLIATIGKQGKHPGKNVDWTIFVQKCIRKARIIGLLFAEVWSTLASV